MNVIINEFGENEIMRIIDYELTYNISFLFGKRIFIYGIGVYGNKVASSLLQMEINVEGFCETSPKKNWFLGKKVFSAEMLREKYDEADVLVIIASEKYYKEMIYELRTTESMALCTYYSLFLSLYLNDEAEVITENLKNNIKFFKKISLEKTIRNFFGWTMEYYYDILSKPSSVWIYQPGKVASASIYWSSPLKTSHLHSLTYAFNADNEMHNLCSDMITKIKNNSIKIITGVREPISRDMSVFLQDTENNIWPFVKYGNCLIYLFGDYYKNNKLNFQILRERICTFEKSLDYSFEYLTSEIVKNKSDEFSWFDYEIKALFGIDIYAYPFDRDKGYTLIKQDNIQILVYKCEKLNQLEKVIGEFLEEPEFVIQSTNQGDEKIYSYVYKRFKEEVKLDKSYFDYYYNYNVNYSRLKHFYTDLEIEQFKNKWKKKIK